MLSERGVSLALNVEILFIRPGMMIFFLFIKPEYPISATSVGFINHGTLSIFASFILARLPNSVCVGPGQRIDTWMPFRPNSSFIASDQAQLWKRRFRSSAI